MNMRKGDEAVREAMGDAFEVVGHALESRKTELKFEEIGIVSFVGKGFARIRGLPHVRSEEVVVFSGGKLGIAFNLDPEEVAVITLDKSEKIRAGQVVHRTGRVMEVPVGDELLGRVVDVLGRSLDEDGPITTSERRRIEREAPAIMDRSPVDVPLETGVMVVDAMVPIGRGQRELILGDRQTGKTAVAIDAIINQRDKDVICVYNSIGQETSEVAKTIADLRKHDAMEECIAVVAAGDDPPGINYIAPYSATTMAEYFVERGRDVLIVYDDLTRHARSYRELSLLLRRPPGREAFPGDIFYIHSRLLERATNLKDGGSLTALPIIETQAQDISAYIPTNLISITDGQIYLSPELYGKGILPAVDAGMSVSRVGGKSQLAAYSKVAGDLRLTYSTFEDLEAYTRFGTRLDEDTRRTLERGQRIREILKQPQFEPISSSEQIAVLLAVTSGLLDTLPLKEVASAKEEIRKALRERQPEIIQKIKSGERLSEEDRDLLLKSFRDALGG